MLDHLPGSLIFLTILVGISGAIWAVNGVQWWRSAQVGIQMPRMEGQSPRLQLQTTGPPELGSYLRGLSIRISDLAREDIVIRDRTFEDCYIYGPAILVPHGMGMFHECGFEGDTSSLFITIAEERSVIGVIALENCIFRRCHFRKIGFIVTPDIHERWVTDLAGHSRPGLSRN
jgi:hypothetical protein